MNLKDWLRNGWLSEHQTSAQEVADLLSVVDRDIKDCQTEGLSADWKLNIAYNAALQLAVLALSACGYRAARESHHYRVIQSLTLTIGAELDMVDQLNSIRKKRNISDYERAGAVSDQEAGEAIALAGDLQRRVKDWLGQHHPELV